MLKVDKVEFWFNDNVYTVNNNQIQNFPFIGGTKANVITNQVWNQNGNTYLDTFMQAEDSTFTFILPLRNKNRYDVEQMRKDIAKVLNPLNGEIQMKVYLNSGTVYNRDVVLSEAISFPVGEENRNYLWQMVQAQFTANNPFWYANEEIVESFQSVEPLFLFPFTMSPEAPVIFGSIRPNNIATNEGQVKAPVTITVNGSCTNPRIDNVTTGEYIAFNNLTMSANDVLEIYTGFGEKRVTLNGTNIFNKLDFSSTFFSLAIGDNEISFSDDSGNATASIHFVYTNQYITV
jgi:hypothetical protein